MTAPSLHASRRTYLDASAAMKLLVDEPESEALTAELSAGDDRRLISSWLLHTEMHRAAGRRRRRRARWVPAVLEAVDLAERARSAGLPVVAPSPPTEGATGPAEA